MAMKTRKLGGQGLEVSMMGLGCMGMSQAYGPADEAESIATLHRSIDLGCTFLDTAEVYGPYTNEDLLGRALAGKRDQLIIATKFGFDIQGGKNVGIDSDPARIRTAVEGSLKRLRTDHIDLLYQHRVDRKTPIEDVAVHPVSALQSEYSVWERNLEIDIIPVLRELGIGIVPFAPLGRGFLTGKVKRADEYPASDFRHNDPRYQGENYDANMKLARIVRDIGTAHDAKPGQIALAWLLRKGEDVVPIPGTKRRSYLEENLAAVDIVLSDEEIAMLDEALAPDKIAGPRYGEAQMAAVDR
jgi:aryl-alcohol dehydrogenase-like predicted oxidoreductase